MNFFLFLGLQKEYSFPPNQQRTLNKLLTELPCRNFVNKHRLSRQVGTKRVYAMCTELPFCMPPLVVGQSFVWHQIPFGSWVQSNNILLLMFKRLRRQILSVGGGAAHSADSSSPSSSSKYCYLKKVLANSQKSLFSSSSSSWDFCSRKCVHIISGGSRKKNNWIYCFFFLPSLFEGPNMAKHTQKKNN